MVHSNLEQLVKHCFWASGLFIYLFVCLKIYLLWVLRV